MTSKTKKLLAATTSAVAATCLVAGTAIPASAHASVIGANISDGQVLSATASARVFTVRFDEAVEAGAGSMRVRSATGRIMSGAAAGSSSLSVRTLGALPRGRYALEYSVISQDEHPVTRAIGFGVGVTTPSSSPKSLSMPGGPSASISGTRVGQRSIQVSMPSDGMGGEVRLTCQDTSKVRAPFVWQLSRSGRASGYLPVACTYTVSVTVERSFPRGPLMSTGSVRISG